ncbi:unnamed protein product, partial [Didymodactylos carnosus]
KEKDRVPSTTEKEDAKTCAPLPIETPAPPQISLVTQDLTATLATPRSTAQLNRKENFGGMRPISDIYSSTAGVGKRERRESMSKTSIIPPSHTKSEKQEDEIFLTVGSELEEKAKEADSTDKPARHAAVDVVWLDNNVDSTNNIRIQRRIAENVHTLSSFTDAEECEKFITKVQDGKFYLIISGDLGEQFLEKHVKYVTPIDLSPDNRSNQLLLDAPADASS